MSSNASQAALYGISVRQVRRIRARDRKALEAMKAYMGRYLKDSRQPHALTAEIVKARTQAFLDDALPYGGIRYGGFREAGNGLARDL